METSAAAGSSLQRAPPRRTSVGQNIISASMRSLSPGRLAKPG
jgi:hypothetical protein